MTERGEPLVQLAECALHEVPGGGDWLSEAERALLGTLRIEKRRRDWRLGRWCARRALLHLADVDPASVVVLAASDGAPEVRSHPHLHVSITHRAERAAAVAAHAPLRVGCDLEQVEPRSEAFIRDYFTASEAAAVLAAPRELRGVLANLCWSAKESVLKAVRLGLTADTRSIDVALPDARALRREAWLPITAKSASAGTFTGCWRWSGDVLLTVLADAPFRLRADQSVS